MRSSLAQRIKFHACSTSHGTEEALLHRAHDTTAVDREIAEMAVMRVTAKRQHYQVQRKPVSVEYGQGFMSTPVEWSRSSSVRRCCSESSPPMIDAQRRGCIYLVGVRKPLARLAQG